MLSYIVAILVMTTGCVNRDTTVEKNKLLGGDYRLFQGTPAWELAKAVEYGDSVKIKDQVNKNKNLLNFRDSIFGQPLLKLAVFHKNYQSVETLLELGADPNMQDSSNGDSPLMEAARIGDHYDGSDIRFLKLLLKFGGNPNSEQDGKGRTKFNTLMIACQGGNLDYVKALIAAGANVNFTNEYGDSPLNQAMDAAGLYGFPEIVIYLIAHGTDFKRVLYKTVPEGENRYITDALRYWRFDLNSEAYKKKMQIVNFLKRNGMDYWKTKIPEEYLKDYPKEYLEKY